MPGVSDRVGTFDPGDLDELLRDQWTAERQRHRNATIVQRIGTKRRHDEVPREHVARVEHVGPLRAEREGAVADGFQRAALAQVERDRDDLGVCRSRSHGMATDPSRLPE